MYQNTLTSTNTTSQTGFEIPGLEVSVNKELLLEAIKKAELIREAEYTKESYQGLVSALDNGRLVYDDNGATQKQVDQATSKINEAILALVKLPTDNDQVSSPQTGDNTNIILPSVLITLTTGVVLSLIKKREI